ncbi:GntP family permease, partial [Citrobacter sp. AAK_AS5]
VVCAFPLLRGRGFRQTNEMLAEAVEKAGPILIITAAGGAFGAVIKATGFGDHVSALLNISSLGLLVPFALAAMLKTAQGSSTVAALTTA